jgi:NADPH:quinone reductase-like Zn-dependent oxidoreductase
MEKYGIDVAIDSFGGDYIKRSYKCLRKKGRLVCMGMSGNNFGGYLPAVISFLQIVRYNSVPDTRKIRVCATPHEVKINRDWYKNELRSIFLKCKNKELDPVIGEIIPF